MSSNKVINPHCPKVRAEKRKKEVALETMKRMMSSGGSNKKKSGKKTATKTTARSIAGKASAASRKESREEKNKRSNFAKRGNWQEHTMKIFESILSKLNNAVEISKRKVTGTWPEAAYPAIIRPTEDPLNSPFLLAESPYDLCREDFSLPALMFWSPET